MKKTNFEKYSQTGNKAPEPSLGSRLVHISLISGCFAAAAIAILCLTLYYFPAQAAPILGPLQELIGDTSPPPEESPPISQGDISETEDSTEYQTSAEPEHSTGQEESNGVLESDEGSDNSGATLPPDSLDPTDPSTDIPMLIYSNEQGNISQIGEQEEDQEFTDADYLVMLDTAMGAMLYYNQGDSRWGDHLYGGVDPIRYYGCGPTVAAMLVNAFTDQPITPKEMADWCAENRCHAPGSGSYHSIFNKTLPAFGLQVESAAGADYDTAAELLRSGHVLVALMGKGEFTNGGHFIIITNILENGNVSIADCNSLENTTMEWDLNLVLAELSRARDSGSPLWAVSLPEETE